MPATLSYDEKIILLGLCKYIINSDGIVTVSEIENLNKISGEKGFKDYQEVFNDVDEKIKSVEDLKELINSIRGCSNMKHILATAIQMSMTDGNIKKDEIEIITFTADSWGFDLKEIIES